MLFFPELTLLEIVHLGSWVEDMVSLWMSFLFVDRDSQVRLVYPFNRDTAQMEMVEESKVLRQLQNINLHTCLTDKLNALVMEKVGEMMNGRERELLSAVLGLVANVVPIDKLELELKRIFRLATTEAVYSNEEAAGQEESAFVNTFKSGWLGKKEIKDVAHGIETVERKSGQNIELFKKSIDMCVVLASCSIVVRQLLMWSPIRMDLGFAQQLAANWFKSIDGKWISEFHSCFDLLQEMAQLEPESIAKLKNSSLIHFK